MKKLLLFTLLLFLISKPCYAVTVTFQQGVNSYVGAEDLYLFDGAATTNQDTFSIIMKCCGENFTRSSLMKWDLSSIPSSATVTSVTITFKWGTDANGAATLYMYESLRNWGETTATWNTFDGSNSWTTAGCRSDGNDMTGTFGTATGDIALINIAGSETTGDIEIMASTADVVASVQTAVSAGGSVNWVWHQKNDDGKNASFHDSENATAGNRPILTVEYTVSSSYFMSLN